MIRNVRTTLTSSTCRQGASIEGLVMFETAGPRKVSEFALAVNLMASLHLAIPTASGIQCHSDKIIYSTIQQVATRDEQARLTRFMIPFCLPIPVACPISSRYKSMADLKHKIAAHVTDLCLGYDPLTSCSMDLTILPTSDVIERVPIIRKQNKITCTMNTNMISGSKYFMQLEHPERLSIQSLRPSLLSDLRVSDGTNKFTRETSRPLPDMQIINRLNPNGSKKCVLIIDVPSQIESSLEVPGFSRKHHISVDIKVHNRSDVVIRSSVLVSQVLQESKSQSTHGRTAIVPMVEDPFNFDMPFTCGPRKAPVPRASLNDLSMDQLAQQALSTSRSQRSTTTLASSPTSPKSMDSSSETSSLLSTGSSSPRSPASSIFSMQIGSQSPTKATSSLECTLPITPVKRHSRQRSSISMLTKRTSAIFSFSNLHKRNSSTNKDFEISCCGAPKSATIGQKGMKGLFRETITIPTSSVEQAQHDRPVTPVNQCAETIDDTPSTPGSCYSSMPASPQSESAEYFGNPPSSPSTTSLLVRKLSMRRSPNRDVPIYDKQLLSPMLDKRFSISDSYLSGFNFEGLSSLDSTDIEDNEEEEEEKKSLVNPWRRTDTAHSDLPSKMLHSHIRRLLYTVFTEMNHDITLILSIAIYLGFCSIAIYLGFNSIVRSHQQS